MIVSYLLQLFTDGTRALNDSLIKNLEAGADTGFCKRGGGCKYQHPKGHLEGVWPPSQTSS